MNKTSKWIGTVAVATMVGLSASAFAYSGHGDGSHRGMGGYFGGPARISVLAEHLDLTDAQRDQIEVLFEQAREASREHVDGLRAARQLLHEQLASGVFDESAIRDVAKAQATHGEELMVLRARSYADLRALLTPEQQEKLAEMKPHRRHHRR